MPSSHTAQHCGAALASVCSFVEEEYIDLDLSSCREFEFCVRRSGGAADELLCRGRLAAAPPGRAARCRMLMPAVAVPAGGVPPWSRRCSTRTPPGSATVLRLRKEGSRRRKAEDVASCQAAGVVGLLPVAVRLDVMLQRAMPRRQKRPAQGQGDAIWRRQEQLLQLQGAVRSTQEPLPPGPGPPQ